MDDVAILPVGDTRLILTSDTMVEGVHYLPTDPPADIGWKLAAVNLSDLAAKGARPIGTNDKAGSAQNLLRWVSPRLIKETFVTPEDYRYPFLG